MIVGLGNPGKEYEKTRHNVGFFLLDSFLSSKDWQKKFDGFMQILTIGEEKVLFLKPMTYMNLSGNSVLKAKNFYSIAIEDILIIQDDMDLSFGSYKLKCNSGAGGHNGIKSILACLGTNAFARLKIGISHSDKDTISHVLGKFSKQELHFLEENVPLFKEIILSFIEQGIEKTMNTYN